MELEELRKRRKQINAEYKKNEKAMENVLSNVQTLADESIRVADVAHNAEQLLDDLDREFEIKTGLQGQDIAFLFLATGLQCLRIYGLNKLTQREKAGRITNDDGSYTLEGKIYKKEKQIMKRFNNGVQEMPELYYAPLNQIIANPKVPYDCTKVTGEVNFFQHANHRFSTLGHDPIFGLFFGTANILTNTISTTVKHPIPRIRTSHVFYQTEIMKRGDLKIGSPMIQAGDIFPCSTIEMCFHVKQRFEQDKKSFAAALIKQILHIGTDMYTKAGIQFPGANLMLTPKQTEKITKYVDWGTGVKAGTSAVFSELINGLISLLHNFMYSNKLGISRDVYNVRTKKIVMCSNAIASGSNIIATGLKVASGNESAIKDLDIGGILVAVHHLIEDPKYIRKLKEEYIFGNFNQMVSGEDLKLLEV
ncbi:hypothetical protein AALA98_16495 [Lachnospiraceae bacterium 45-W7]